MGCGVGVVYVPSGEFHFVAAERCYGVNHKERVVGFRQLRQALKGLADAGGCFGVYGGDHLDVGMALEFGLKHFFGEGAAPVGAEGDDVCAQPRRHLYHALAEKAVDAHNHGIAGLEQAAEAGLHSGGAGA